MSDCRWCDNGKPTQTDSYVAHATYNIFDDLLKFQLADGVRFSQSEWESAECAGFVFWPGRNLYVAKWSPECEDFITQTLGATITDDDTPDDVEARIERYEAHAANAANAANAAAERETHTRRQTEQAARTFDNESEKAVYWQRRIAGAVSRAIQKEDAGVIARRIAKLQAETRSHERVIKRYKYNEIVHQVPMDKGDVERRKRWIEHLAMFIALNQALLAEKGELAWEAKPLEVGGAVRIRHRWVKIIKVNAKTLKVNHDGYWVGTVQKNEVKEILTKAEYEAQTGGEHVA
jgi:hypothetical protein